MSLHLPRLAASLLAASLLADALPAGADAPAPALVRLLRRASRPHPLAAPATGRIPITVPLPKGVSALDLGLLPVAPGIGAIHLYETQIDAFAAAYPGLSLHVTPPRRALLDRSVGWTRTDAFRQAIPGADGSGVVIGIIDTGLDISHPDFRDENGKTRVTWMLTPESPRGVHDEIEKDFGCSDPDQQPCAVYSADDIDAILASGQDHSLRDAEGHGTHVTSIAAGNGGVMLKGKPRYVGIAPKASLIVVNAARPGGGFSDADVLNAARFVFDRAEVLGPPDDLGNPTSLPAVINLSVGGDFGPHDGTSDLEKGLAAMVGDNHPGRALVVAAGNSGGIYYFNGYDDPFGIHTEVHVSPNALTRVPIVGPGAKNGRGYIWITFRPGDEVSVGLEGPGGETWIDLIEPGADRGYEGENVSGGVINNIVNGKAPLTTDTNSAVVAWEGAWKSPGEFAILMKGHGDAQLWITALGDVSPTTSVGLLFKKAIKQGTITVPASHPSLLSVGCTINRLTWTTAEGSSIGITALGGDETLEEDSLCYFSSAGPTPFGVAKPEISAPGGFVTAAMSADADPRDEPGGLFDQPGCPTDQPFCYVVDDSHAITAGTSMSSPHVAGAIALLLQQRPNLTQAQAIDILQAGARYPKAAVPFETQLGPGALDLEGARAALDLDMVGGAAVEPDVQKSWYVLSSSYARPDRSWPVWGTVELRRADGAVASGLDGTLLELEVVGGVVVQPLTKVRHGMWRFAIAGEKGTGGSSITLDVTYDGQSLGLRSIPIGTDVWTASGGIEAVGGCAIAGSGGVGGSALGTLFAAALLAAVERIRRRNCPAAARGK